MVEISIHLFSKPEVEIDLEKAKPEDFRKLGEELQTRLSRASEIIEKLGKNGWKRSAGLYDVSFYKKIKPEEAREELKKLDIKEDEVDISEEDFDEEEFEDEKFEDDYENQEEE